MQHSKISLAAALVGPVGRQELNTSSHFLKNKILGPLALLGLVLALNICAPADYPESNQVSWCNQRLYACIDRWPLGGPGFLVVSREV